MILHLSIKSAASHLPPPPTLSVCHDIIGLVTTMHHNCVFLAHPLTGLHIVSLFFSQCQPKMRIMSDCVYIWSQNSPFIGDEGPEMFIVVFEEL